MPSSHCPENGTAKETRKPLPWVSLRLCCACRLGCPPSPLLPPRWVSPPLSLKRNTAAAPPPSLAGLRSALPLRLRFSPAPLLRLRQSLRQGCVAKLRFCGSGEIRAKCAEAPPPLLQPLASSLAAVRQCGMNPAAATVISKGKVLFFCSANRKPTRGKVRCSPKVPKSRAAPCSVGGGAGGARLLCALLAVSAKAPPCPRSRSPSSRCTPRRPLGEPLRRPRRVRRASPQRATQKKVFRAAN